MSRTSGRFLLGMLFVIGGCGSRTALEDGPGSGSAGGESGVGGGGAGNATPDPDVACPLAGCSSDECLPSVLTEGRPLAWFTVDGGDLYFATNDSDPPNQLVRVPVCGGEPVVLLERDRFAGEGLIVGDDLYIPVEEPAREVLRLPKTGGAPVTVHSHDSGDPYTTRAISEHQGYLFLSEYSFDGGLVLLELASSGSAHALNENLPDADWFEVFPEARLFIPNKPSFIAPGDDVYRLFINSQNGIFRVAAFDPKYASGYFLDTVTVEHPAVGHVIVADPSNPDSALYFSADDNLETQVHFKVEGETLTPILPEGGGVLAAIDGDRLWGTSNYFGYDELGQPEAQGSVWQAAESDSGGEGVLRTYGQNVYALELHGESVYVRTTSAVLRFPKSCQTADGPCRFSYGQ